MKLGFLCPRLPPERCGVGDYSARLVNELVQQGHEVSVWSPGSFSSLDPRTRCFPITSHAIVPGARELEEIKKAGLDVFIIQYSSSIFYQREKIFSLKLESALSGLGKKTQTRLFIIAHEVHYPLQFSRLGIAQGFPQYLHFYLLSRMVHGVIFSYEAAWEAWRFWSKISALKKTQLSWLPVGSNIPRVPSSGVQARTRPVLIHFGGAHPTHLLEYIFFAMDRLYQKLGEGFAQVLFIGLDETKLSVELKKYGFNSTPSWIRSCGYLEPDEVSKRLQNADLLLAPFMDGISTRRGSTMAAFEHRLPVLTTLGWASETSTPWSSLAEVVPVDAKPSAKEAYAERLEYCLDHLDELREGMAERARKYFEDQFSWPAIARGLIERIES